MNQPSVFVSYARNDREAVRHVLDELKKLGVRTWVDSEQLVPGDAWVEKIGEALSAAQAIVVFLSPASVASSWIANELDYAVRRGIRVIPILLTGFIVDAGNSRS